MASYLPMKRQVLLPRIKSQLINFLQHEHVHVQVAAGECVTLICNGKLDEQDEDDANLLQLMEQVSSTANKSVGKKDQSKLKQGFREYLATLQLGEEPQEKVTIRKIGIHIHGWPATIVLNALRFFLGAGWMKHVQLNPLVRSLLDVEQVVFHEKHAAKLTSGEKKMLYSKNSAKNKMETIEKHKKTKQFANFLNDE